MVDSKQVQDGGLQVMHVNTVLGNVVAVRISSSVGRSCFYPSTGHPHGKTSRVVVAAKIVCGEFALAIVSATEFAAPDDECVIEQVSLFEVLDEGSRCLVGLPALGANRTWEGCRAGPIPGDRVVQSAHPARPGAGRVNSWPRNCRDSVRPSRRIPGHSPVPWRSRRRPEWRIASGKAISYCAIRASRAGSAFFASCRRCSSCRRSSISRRLLASTPCGLFSREPVPCPNGNERPGTWRVENRCPRVLRRVVGLPCSW